MFFNSLAEYVSVHDDRGPSDLISPPLTEQFLPVHNQRLVYIVREKCRSRLRRLQLKHALTPAVQQHGILHRTELCARTKDILVLNRQLRMSQG